VFDRLEVLPVVSAGFLDASRLAGPLVAEKVQTISTMAAATHAKMKKIGYGLFSQSAMERSFGSTQPVVRGSSMNPDQSNALSMIAGNGKSFDFRAVLPKTGLRGAPWLLQNTAVGRV